MVKNCRLCNSELTRILRFEDFALTGVFPRLNDPPVTRGPMTLMRCDSCGLLQLREEYSLDAMYGDNYGYRSGLNSSMVRHLADVAQRAWEQACATNNDIIVDIGANDGTLLHQFPASTVRIAIDPTANKFKEYYEDDIQIIPEFFSRDVCPQGPRGVRIVTSVAMFYDVPDPIEFARDVHEVLADDGLWYVEVAYAPRMLERTSYDAICQEHLCYYGISQLRDVACRAGFYIASLDFNDTNGGSVGVTLRKKGVESDGVSYIAHEERRNSTVALIDFRDSVTAQAIALHQLLAECGDRVAGFGASTKGNTMMQHCNINRKHVFAVADVNKDKWGRVTATGIPIMSDEDVDALEPTHYLVFPWHFRENILERYAGTGRKFIFPLPEPEVVVA